MYLNTLIPYIEHIQNVNTAIALLECESDPEGYYSGIYQQITNAIIEDAPESVIEKMFEDYEEESAIKHFQYMYAIWSEIRGNRFQSLMGKTTFLNAISSIDDIYDLRLYLVTLNNKLNNHDIYYKEYVPTFRAFYKR